MDNRTSGLRQYYVGVGTVDAKLPTLVELLQALRVDTRLALAVACSSRDSVDAVVYALASCSGFNIAVLHSDLELHEMERQLMQLKRRLHPQQQQQQPHVEVAQQSAEDPSRPPQQQPADQQQHLVMAAAAAAPPARLTGAATGTGPPFTADQPSPTPPLDPSTALPAAAVWNDSRSLVLVTTDVCLKALPKELLPFGLQLLIEYDLPASKDVLQRRLAAVFGSSKERSRKAGRQVVIDFVAAGEVAAFRARQRLSSGPVMDMPVHVPDIFS